MVSSEQLMSHLRNHYAIRPTTSTSLDVDVSRIDREDGPAWVARVFPADRTLEQIHGDAHILRALQKAGFPAERCAHADPVSTLDDRGVLVTELVDGAPATGRTRTFAILGELLGRLSTRSAQALRDGGAWHHIAPAGGPREEIAAARAMLAGASIPPKHKTSFDIVRAAADSLDDCADLPHAFVHPDFVPANAIATPDGHLTIVDWTNAGRGPRIWSLGFLLFAAGARNLSLVDTVVARYRTHISLEPDELARLGAVIRARPLVLSIWSWCYGRIQLPAVADDVATTADLAEMIAARARESFAAG